MKSDNELIAEFMGYVKKPESYLYIMPPPKDNYVKDCRDFAYDKSWDWLMPVVEKIHKIKGAHVIIRQTTCEVYMWGKIISGNGQEGFMQSVYKAVIDFIKWYNTQPK